MKYSIKHLPKNTQEELNLLLELILKAVADCKMVILYGSYARGGYVLWDEKIEFGHRTSYQSDLDILVVVDSASPFSLERKISEKTINKYEKRLAHRRYAPPQVIVETINVLNKRLENGQYFYSDIVKDGIRLYDNKEFKLSKPRNLSYQEIKDIAVEEYDLAFTRATNFLKGGLFYLNEKDYEEGSFMLHQTCEKLYNTISIVFTNYIPKFHELEKLGARVKRFSRELSAVFPQNTKFEKHCYKLLCLAYVEGRYNKDFVVTKEELSYMIERAEILKDITERICKEKIESYDSLIISGDSLN